MSDSESKTLRWVIWLCTGVIGTLMGTIGAAGLTMLQAFLHDQRVVMEKLGEHDVAIKVIQNEIIHINESKHN